MRTLQRRTLGRQPSFRQLNRIHAQEAESVAKKKRGIWARRARRGGLLAALVLLVWAVHAVVGRGVVLDGLVVHESVVRARAPGLVRVLEVMVRPGQRCRRGDVLARTEGLQDGERRVLELDVELKRRRLALARAGAELGTTELDRRADLASGARADARMAEAELGVERARLDALEEERERLALELDRDRLARAGRLDGLQLSLSGARASLSAARAEDERAGFDAGAKAALSADGIVARGELVEARAEESVARFEVEEAATVVEALRRDVLWQDRLGLAEERRGEAALQEVDARIVAQRRVVESVVVRCELLAEIAAWREELLPPGEPDAGRLRALELELLQTELAQAEARVTAHDEGRGNGVLVAQFDGIVDGVFVHAGSVVESGGELLSYYDPAQVQVIAYLPPDRFDRLAAGLECSVFRAGSSSGLRGTVEALGTSLVARPEVLPRLHADRRDVALPVRVRPRDTESWSELRPNMLLKIVVPGERILPWL